MRRISVLSAWSIVVLLFVECENPATIFGQRNPPSASVVELSQTTNSFLTYDEQIPKPSEKKSAPANQDNKKRDGASRNPVIRKGEAPTKNVSIPDRSETDAKPGKTMHAGLSPEEAATAMTVPEGFKVQLFAGEPDVKQPIAMCFDDRGRLWVAEAYTYPIRMPGDKGKDRILIFEDTDGDGKFDKRTVFIENLNLVSGIEVGFGGVWVGAAPYLLFIPDANGDDIPDGPPQVMLDGWSYQDTHETLNTFTWGPDGWLYGCHGVFTFSNVGKPGAADSERKRINAGIWRYHPVKHEFEVFIEGTSNPWGIDFNDRGHAFLTACVIPHLYHLQQGGRYLRQAGQHYNPYTFEDIDTIAEHRHWIGANPHAGNGKSDAVGGGHAHAGAMFYLGGAWPEKYKDKLFMNNIHGSRLNMDNIVRNGLDSASYTGKAAPDFCYANDSWSQILNLQYGPDGQVTMIDWYDKQQCHDGSHAEVHDRTNGRIFKIVYGNPEPVKSFDLKKLSDLELARLALDKNDWYVRHARRILQERAASGTVAQATVEYLVNQFYDLTDTSKRLRLLWAIHAAGGKEADADFYSLLLRFMSTEKDPDVRAWLIQLAAEDQKVPVDLLKTFIDLAKKDPSPIVREYLASAMMRISLADRWNIAAALLQHAEDASDHNLPYVYWYAIEPLVMTDVTRATELARNCKIPKLSRFIVRRIAAEESGYDELLKFVTSSKEDAQEWILNEIVMILKTRANMKMPSAWNQCYDQLAQAKNQTIRERASFIAIKFGDSRAIPAMRKIVADRKTQIRSRIGSLDGLIAAHDEGLPPILHKLLDDEDMRLLAINALADFDHKETPAMLIENYSKFTDIEKQSAIATLTSRTPFTLALFDAIAAKKIPTRDISAAIVSKLAHDKNEVVLKRLNEIWGQVRETSSNVVEEMKNYKEKLTPDVLAKADLSNGRALFNKTCGTCHKLFDAGNTIGPELTGSNRRVLEYLLENILDPSATVGKDYQTTNIVTKKGRQISGIIKNENDTAISLQTPTDLVKVDKTDIAERELSKMSLMPEGQLKPFSDKDVADLIAYLQGSGQVSLPGSGPKIDSVTGKVADAFEGETLLTDGHVIGIWAVEDTSHYIGKWSESAQGLWRNAQPGDKLKIRIPLPATGRYEIFAGLTEGPGYAKVNLKLNQTEATTTVDLYEKEITSAAPISLGVHNLNEGRQILEVEIVGSNPEAKKDYLFGLDYISCIPQEEKK